jgi:hypothetical protein
VRSDHTPSQSNNCSPILLHSRHFVFVGRSGLRPGTNRSTPTTTTP